MEQGDITYRVEEHVGQFQAIITLTCLGGEEFAGEPKMTPKAAEHAAAHQVLAAHVLELNEQQERKRIATTAGGGPWGKKARFDVDHAVKGKLHTAVAQILGRSAGQTD